VSYHCFERSCRKGNKTDDVKDGLYKKLERMFDKFPK
jgi:hypothetical protein